MRRLKIAVWHNLPSGGGKRALYHHVKGLVERGHTVESWCPSTADQTYLPLSSLIRETIIPLKTPRRRFGLFPSLGWRMAAIQSMHIHSQHCAEEISQGGFDILFANSCQLLLSPIIGRYVKIPRVLYLGEPNRSFYEARPELFWLALPEPKKLSLAHLNQFLRNLIKVQSLRYQAREELDNAKAFDLVLVNSLFSRESILRAYGLDSTVCYLGIDTSLFQPLNLPRQNFVIGLGNLYQGKGVDRAVRAIATVDSVIRPTLLWVGNSVNQAYREEIEQLAAALAVDFIYKILVPDSQLIELLNQASVMIYSSILEPFGLAPLEANACGTPVVAIAEGGIRESIQNGVNGFLIQGNDSIAFGDAISELLTNEELRIQMSFQARKNALEHWSLNTGIDRLETLLNQLVS